MPCGIFDTLMEDTCLRRHVATEGPDSLTHHGYPYGDGQDTRYNRRGEEPMLGVIERDAVVGHNLIVQPLYGDALQKGVVVAAMRGEHPVCRLDMLEDGNQVILIAPAEVNRGVYHPRLKEEDKALLKGDKFLSGGATDQSVPHFTPSQQA